MDTSGISTSASANSFAASSRARAEFHGAERMEATREARHDHHHDHHGEGRRGLALGVFKQELRMALETNFNAKFAVTQQGYVRQQESATSDDVAEEALSAAKQLVAAEPTNAAKSLISFRAKVQETATYVRNTVGDRDNVAELDDAEARLDQGLAKLEDEVDANRESSSSVLEVDTRIKQRSSIKIRTQEGDVVKLNLRLVDKMSASNLAYADDGMSISSTEVAVSSRSRMTLKVEGDLNDAEMNAIQNVFAQAEMIADEFFGGDIGAAFNIAQGFEFDSGQLARVNLSFKMRQLSNVSYEETVRPAAIAPATAAPEPVTEPAAVAMPEALVNPVDEEPVTIDGESVAEAIVPTESVATSTPSPGAALSTFFEQLSAFLRTVGEGFEVGSDDTSYSYHYSESFKFNLLKVVMHTIAPADAGKAAENAESIIGQIIDNSAPEDA
ncbi:MAG: hypothetical protein GY935_11505 [Gammaproteobacteria bacterium]|nr:hypothetical protein [Gammaproteobacteria bacterium]